ncbi:MAG: TM2 domain-containing protein [Deltaproteobacteria bacterium]|nr:TM2 domain-containing protein [Deltaproteobacteria bacterium]
MRHEIVKRDQDQQVLIAYALMLPAFLGVFGLHRFYAGRWISGLIWLATGGLCGVGQIIDIFFVPRMIEDKNEGRKVW